MTCADDLTFSFTLDDRDQKYEHIKDYELFYLTKTTIKKLTEAAAAAGVEIEPPVVLPGTINYRLGENRELFSWSGICSVVRIRNGSSHWSGSI